SVAGRSWPLGDMLANLFRRYMPEFIFRVPKPADRERPIGASGHRPAAFAEFFRVTFGHPLRGLRLPDLLRQNLGLPTAGEFSGLCRNLVRFAPGNLA